MEKEKEREMTQIINDIEFAINEDATLLYASLKKIHEEIEKKDVVQMLRQIDIRDGFDYDNIDLMLREKKLNRKYVVAKSKLPEDGKDGWFEYFFNTEIDTKPRILKDGSVDYSEYGNLPSVEEGQLIAVYHPSLPCVDGVNFFGETIVATKGRDLAKLKGKGFYVAENGKEYYAKFSGKVTCQNDYLTVENELVIEGDASIATGDVEFINDIHVRGNVLSGVKIKSVKGSIIVDGYVEACNLEAAKEVVLKNGMQGNGKGTIKAGGSVSGKFFEQVTIISGEDISANAIMNSHVEALQDIVVSGKFGIIIGGSISAERFISATIIGNMSEVKTKIFAGVDRNLIGELNIIEEKLKEFEKDMSKIINGIEKIDSILSKTKNPELNNKKIKLLRVKISLENDISIKQKEKQCLLDSMGRANQAKVTVLKSLYPGTLISINGIKTHISEAVSSVELATKGAAIQMYSLN